jgi:alpha-glucosidase (family GH31 glycosyl hydrolase)
MAITLAVGGRQVVAHPSLDSPPAPSHNLGGWQRSFDPWTYDHPLNCPSNASGPTCQAALPPLHDGLLSTDGWYLLDDTQTALWSPPSWPRPRPQHVGALQDGYFFGYGHDYKLALHELAQLTGPAPLLPKWMFGISYTRCCTYGQSDYENRVVPDFRADHVPLDALVVDTQWKTSTPSSTRSVQEDDGWNWNPTRFPRPQQFLDWAHAQGLRTALNVHPTIEEVDPRFRQADRIAGGLLAAGDGSFGWNWSDPRHAESFSSVHEPFARQGLDFWWLDWCCDRISEVTLPGLTPDTWVNQLYAEDLTRRSQRGFVLSRIGASTQEWTGAYRSGPWAEHRYSVHFTGDTWSTWNTLAFESLMTIREGNIGVPYVSHDIGGYLGPPPGGKDTDELYARWVQFGAFQPVLRLHGTAERLPWEYGPAARASADRFLQLREELIPYIYTTAREAYDTAVPMVRGLYLDYPEEPMAYRFDQEYMFGDEMLVAPVTSPGAVASTQVWFPPGGWTDLFTGLRYQGPGVATVASSLQHTPVFVRGGGIVPMKANMDHIDADPTATTLLRVFAGQDRSYRIYDDAGQGLGYVHAQYAWTLVTHDEDGHGARITIGAAQGTYPGQPAHRTFAVDVVGISEPSSIRVGPSALGRIAPGAMGPGWWYEALTHTVHVVLGPTATNQPVRIAMAGGHDLP